MDISNTEQVHTYFHHLAQDVKILYTAAQISEQIPSTLRSLTYFHGWTLQVWGNGCGLDFRLLPVLLPQDLSHSHAPHNSILAND